LQRFCADIDLVVATDSIPANIFPVHAVAAEMLQRQSQQFDNWPLMGLIDAGDIVSFAFDFVCLLPS
jgi:hypothetical protein